MVARICFAVAAAACILSYGLTGEWYWMLLAVGNAVNAYVFGPEKDEDEAIAA